MSSIKLMGYNIFGLQLSDIVSNNKQQIINTINAYSYVIAKRDKLFNDALKSSDILLPDGFPVVWGVKLVTGKKVRKIAGEDIFYHLMRQADAGRKKVFFLGASVSTLSLIERNIKVQYPNVLVASYSPPYKANFSEHESNRMIGAVAEFKPDILFVGMTAPKQEKWVFDHKEQLNAVTICSIGAVFDFYAGTISRPSQFWVDNNLEWFARFLKEPKRLFKRYFIYSPVFFKDLMIAWLKK
jgi:N-acetylglucosaminyldiphosphoundecaprenol N-acetyl-beta-D-mannosaminyltransferase